MKAAPFDYHSPASVSEAVALLDELETPRVLAGGQSLLAMLSMRLAQPSALVDLGAIDELRTIASSSAEVTIGAMVTQRTVERDGEVAAAAPLLTSASKLTGHPPTRTRGTLGGSLSHADPAAEYPAAALALGATMNVVGTAGARQVPADEFFVGPFATALAPDEVLVSTSFPRRRPRSGFAIDEIGRHGDFAIAGAAVQVELDGDDKISRAAIALFGVSGTPVLAEAAQRSLEGTDVQSTEFDAVAREALDGIDVIDTIHASARYRRRVASVVVERVLQRAVKEACA